MIVLLFTSWNTLVNWILQDKLFFSYLKNKRFLIHHCRSIPVIRNNDTKYIGLSDDDDAIESWWWWRWWYYRMVWNQKEAPATFRQFASSHEFYSPSTKSEIWFKNYFWESPIFAMPGENTPNIFKDEGKHVYWNVWFKTYEKLERSVCTSSLQNFHLGPFYLPRITPGIIF